MKKSLLFMLLTLMGHSMMAKPVEPEKAAQVAKNFVAQYVKGANQYSAEVVYTHLMPKSRQAAMYVVNVGNTFVLVSANDVAHPVLGYSLSRPWPTKSGERADAGVKLPSQITSYLDDLAGQIEAASGVDPDQETASEWQQLLTLNSQLLTTNPPDSVGPLLTTTWDQSPYYNALCPKDVNGQAVTGCVATAMAQIINYWGYPIHGRGTHSYNSNYGTLSVNYDSANYDYANMPSELTAASTPAQVNAVATLMRDCGVALNMDYAANGSGAFDQEVRTALINYFKYNPNLSLAEEAFFLPDEWKAMLKNDLDAGRPIYYAGITSNLLGHAFVCDGYKQNGFFHFNFGWSGLGDGWYMLSAVNPYGMCFSVNRTAIFGIVPDGNSNVILGQMQGNNTFTINEPLEFYHLLGHNQYAGASYGNNCNNTVTFVNADSNQMVVDIIEFEDQSVDIYNGADTSNLIRHLCGGCDNNINPVLSIDTAITLTYKGNFLYGGFKLVISNSDECRMVSNVRASVDSTSVVLSWTENGTASNWHIEYGLDNFVLGEGYTINTNDTIVNVTGLIKNEDYDFYIQPECGTWFGPVKVQPRASYWSDIVHSIPEGYVADTSGNITISTAEGLAWWAKQVNNSVDTWPIDSIVFATVTLTSDIDLDGYLWKPVYEYYGNFNGNGHVIKNLTIIEKGENSQRAGYGFFRLCCDNTISDLGFKDPYIRIKGGSTGISPSNHSVYWVCTGVLSGFLTRANVINCGVANGTLIQTYAYPSLYDGLLTGKISETSIMNCYASGEIKTVSYMVGGFVGFMQHDGNNIQNCYSSVDVARRVASFCGGTDGGTIHNCYSIEDSIPLFVNQNAILCNIIDTRRFDKETLLLNDSVIIDSVGCSDLLTALNRRVEYQNSDNWRIWQEDTAMVNGGFPIFGDYFSVVCPNVDSINAINVEKDSGYAIRVSWSNAYNEKNWMVKYWETDSLENTALYIETDTNVIELLPSTIGVKYNICVRGNCDNSHHSSWGNPVQIIYDKPYWTDVVTTLPNGYFVDEEGNITILSAEGLAWLAKCANGEEGLNNDYYRNINVHLQSDIDLDFYKWKPIRQFYGNIYGHGHTISNIYCREDSDLGGLISDAIDGEFRDININGNVIAHSLVGGLMGTAMGVSIKNCHSAVNVMGFFINGGKAGSLVGEVISSEIINCSATGDVSAISMGGGLVGMLNHSVIINCFATGSLLVFEPIMCYIQRGGLVGSMFGNNIIRNSYASGEIQLRCSAASGTLSGYSMESDEITNCYGKIDTNELGINGVNNQSVNCHDNTLFNINGRLVDTVEVDGIIYEYLLDALNAWVDANNTEGGYRHWAADSTGVNGGFPVFAYIPCTPTTGSDSIVVCDSYTWHNTLFTESTTLTDTLTNIAGCDSIVMHYLIVNHPVHTATNETACESYAWNGTDYTASGAYTYIHLDANNCMQVDTLHLTINTPVHTATTQVACEAYTWTAGSGTTYTDGGNYIYAHADSNGCTQVDTLHLTINNPVHTATTEVVCDSYTWQGATITVSGDYTFPHDDANGCTQVDTLHLTINYSDAVNEIDTACEDYFFGGEWITVSGQYTDTLTNAAGCDSIATLILTINNPVHTATTVTACDSYTWQESIITTSGTYHYTHTDAHGCTQDDTLYLTINHNDTVIVDEEVCDSLTWYGTTYTASAYGVQYLIVPNTVGCDSIFFLDLTVNYTTYGEMSAVSCDSYAWDWNGAVYTASGDYTYRDTVNMNSQFCDSILTLHLTINHSATSDTTATACDLFVWYGHMGYDVSGNYEHRWWNVTADGCDSILTMHLTINHSAETTVTDTAEGSYTWNGTTYTESGTYTWTGETVEGCDSSVTLILTINQVGIFDIQNSEFKINIFPNPTTDLLTIDADDIFSVELFDLNGRRIFSSEVDSSPFTVHLSPFTLSAGSYLLRIHTRQGTAVQHVILK